MSSPDASVAFCTFMQRGSRCDNVHHPIFVSGTELSSRKRHGRAVFRRPGQHLLTRAPTGNAEKVIGVVSRSNWPRKYSSACRSAEAAARNGAIALIVQHDPHRALPHRSHPQPVDPDQ
ncbi:MAG: hypothetical protein CMN72_11460 [Sphingomonas sp.]|nr:hypothetical protein [Sphingomonas sp.]